MGHHITSFIIDHIIDVIIDHIISLSRFVLHNYTCTSPSLSPPSLLPPSLPPSLSPPSLLPPSLPPSLPSSPVPDTYLLVVAERSVRRIALGSVDGDYIDVILQATPGTQVANVVDYFLTADGEGYLYWSEIRAPTNTSGWRWGGVGGKMREGGRGGCMMQNASLVLYCYH